MITVWILQNSSKHPRLVDGLIGDFTLRAFASLKSILCLVEYSPPEDFPLVLIVDEEIPNQDIFKKLRKACKTLVYFRQKNSAEDFADSIIFDHSETMCDDVRILLKSLKGDSEKSLRYKDLDFYPKTMQLRIMPNENPCDLSLKEAKLLNLFLNKPNLCLSKEEIHKTVWGCTKVSPRTIDSQVSRLRSKLKDSEACIASIYGGGYKLG